MKTTVFIDFQGTIGGTGTDDIMNLSLYPFTCSAIKLLNSIGVLVIGLTNQSNISRGLLTQGEYDEKLKRIENEMKENDAFFDAVYCCPHSHSDNCGCKKPKKGLIDEACRDFDIELKSSYVIGDMGMNDMVLAKNIGAKGILVLTGVGKGSLAEFRHTWQDTEPCFITENLFTAAEIINGEINAEDLTVDIIIITLYAINNR